MEVVAKEGSVRIPRSRWGGINRQAVTWRDISCKKHFGYGLVEMSVPIYYDDPELLILEPNQHYSTPQNRPNSTPSTEPIQTQPNPPYPSHHPPHTTHLPPRRYYAPLPSPPDHHYHHHPTHPAHPTSHPEGTMHLCLRPPTTTTTTQYHTTQPPTHPPIRDDGVFHHRCICSIVNKLI